MKPSNIIPCRKYKHSDFPFAHYLGIYSSIRKGKSPSCQEREKNLIVLDSGSVVFRPGQIGKGGNKFWSKFSLAD